MIRHVVTGLLRLVRQNLLTGSIRERWARERKQSARGHSNEYESAENCETPTCTIDEFADAKRKRPEGRQGREAHWAQKTIELHYNTWACGSEATAADLRLVGTRKTSSREESSLRGDASGASLRWRSKKFQPGLASFKGLDKRLDHLLMFVLCLQMLRRKRDVENRSGALAETR
jgi:hypothetical protein